METAEPYYNNKLQNEPNLKRKLKNQIWQILEFYFFFIYPKQKQKQTNKKQNRKFQYFSTISS